jgi:hypothetical protein
MCDVMSAAVAKCVYGDRHLCDCHMENGTTGLVVKVTFNVTCSPSPAATLPAAIVVVVNDVGQCLPAQQWDVVCPMYTSPVAELAGCQGERYCVLHLVCMQ